MLKFDEPGNSVRKVVRQLPGAAIFEDQAGMQSTALEYLKIRRGWSLQRWMGRTAPVAATSPPRRGTSPAALRYDLTPRRGPLNWRPLARPLSEPSEPPENMCAHRQRHQAEAPGTESEQRRRQKRAERHRKEPKSRQKLICMRAGASGGPAPGASVRHQKEPRAALYMGERGWSGSLCGLSLFKRLERLFICG